MIPSHSFSTSVSLQTEMPKQRLVVKKGNLGQMIHVKGKAMLKNTLILHTHDITETKRHQHEQKAVFLRYYMKTR